MYFLHNLWSREIRALSAHQSLEGKNGFLQHFGVRSNILEMYADLLCLYGCVSVCPSELECLSMHLHSKEKITLLKKNEFIFGHLLGGGGVIAGHYLDKTLFAAF